MAAGDTAYVAYCLTATQEGTGSQTFIGTFLIDSPGDTDPPNGAGPPDDIRGNNDAVVSVAISPGGPNPGCSNSLPKPPPGPGQDSCKGNTPTIIATGPKTVGTDGDDVIAGFGNKKNESIKGKDGNDIICGGKKNDAFIDGGKGNDKLYGKDKKDSLHGGKGNDLVDGGESRDVLHGDQGKDTCIGDKQIDFIVNTCEEIKNK
jgi:Ca2+-binding RTX toxin-like protein